MRVPFGVTVGGTAIPRHDGNILAHFRSEGVDHGTAEEPARTKGPQVRAGANLVRNADGSISHVSTNTSAA